MWEKKRKGCVAVGFLEPLSEQAENDIVGSEMEDVGTRRFRQSTRKSALKKFHQIRLFRGNEVVECAMLRKLDLTARGMLRRKAVRDGVARSDSEHQGNNARPESNVKYYEGLHFVVLQSPLRELEVVAGTELAALAVIGERAVVKRWKGSCTERNRECGCSVAQFIKRVFGT